MVRKGRDGNEEWSGQGRGEKKGLKGRGCIPSPQNSTQIYAYAAGNNYDDIQITG